MQVEQIDRELFIILSNADGQMAERILCGEAFTWEVEQIARHRIAERERVVGEIVAWLRDQDRGVGWLDYDTAQRIEAKFGESHDQ